MFRMEGQLQFGGYRPDGVLLIGVGAHQMVLVNILDGFKTTPIDELDVNRYGPWTACKPSKEVRARVKHLIDAPGHIVSPEQVGSDVVVPNGPTRQEFVDMLQAASLDVPTMLPDVKSFAAEPDFLGQCLSEVVPQMQQAGMTIDDPSSFCALMHLERTGIMPRGETPQTMPDQAAPAAPAAPGDTGAPPVAPLAADVPLTPDQPPRTVDDPPPFAEQQVVTEPPIEGAAPAVVSTQPSAVAVEAPVAVLDPALEPAPVVDETPSPVEVAPPKSAIGKPFKKPRSLEGSIGKPQ